MPPGPKRVDRQHVQPGRLCQVTSGDEAEFKLRQRILRPNGAVDIWRALQVQHGFADGVVARGRDARVRVPVPDALEEVLSPAWLNEALAPRLAGTRIVAVEPGEVVSRVSTNVRFHIVCDGALPQDLSPDLCIKGYFAHPAA